MSRDGCYGYVNRRGEIVIDCIWNAVSDFDGGLCVVEKKVAQDYSYGLMNANGVEGMPAQWYRLGESGYAHIEAPEFINGRIVVKGKEGFGLMDTQGVLHGPAHWQTAPDISLQNPSVCLNNQYGFIDLNGEVIVDVKYAQVQDFTSGLAEVSSDGECWGFINLNGEAVIPEVYEAVMPFSGGVAHVKLPGREWQIINETGLLVYFVTPRLQEDYDTAMSLMANGDYEAAAALFTGTIGYRDSYAQLTEARRLAPLKRYYDNGVDFYAKGEYAEAIGCFAMAGDYGDAEAQLEAVMESAYQQGMKAYQAGDLVKALELLEIVSGYKDADDVAAQIRAGVEDVVTVTNTGEYGFVLNENGFYESNNQGVPKSYAICTVTVRTATGHVYIDYISVSEKGKDYGIVSRLDSPLAHRAASDGLANMALCNPGVSENVRTLEIAIPDTGEHTITIKYIKDGKGDFEDDSFQFRIRFE